MNDQLPTDAHSPSIAVMTGIDEADDGQTRPGAAAQATRDPSTGAGIAHDQ
jgi:hypothetical protein